MNPGLVYAALAYALWRVVRHLDLTALTVSLGVLAGRRTWQAFAQGLGVPDQTVTPVLAIAAVAVIAVIIAILTAAIPARLAARTPPAVALRAE